MTWLKSPSAQAPDGGHWNLGFSLWIRWCPSSESLSWSSHNSNFTMVYGRYIELVTMVYKLTYNWGGTTLYIAYILLCTTLLIKSIHCQRRTSVKSCAWKPATQPSDSLNLLNCCGGFKSVENNKSLGNIKMPPSCGWETPFVVVPFLNREYGCNHSTIAHCSLHSPQEYQKQVSVWGCMGIRPFMVLK